MAERRPFRGEVWEHTKTKGLYAVVGYATDKEHDGPPDGLVVYRKLHYGAYYVRSMDGFSARFTYQYGPQVGIALEADKDEREGRFGTAKRTPDGRIETH